ncbi:hypothetical protein C8A03DRAFT_39552 [Achaetomium macrosporum]|uniref:Uncharacterized protein n=1 Tax=Achaetomium macrosporum TaxID=79813 RepID=A0AAN7C073_9PEZI|nr:hypothetical protein C8A03DRAFT_39552 [Achaetomium macrosporum]
MSVPYDAEISSSPPEFGQSVIHPSWSDVDVKGSGRYATWRKWGWIEARVGWEHALSYARDHYLYVSALPNGVGRTRNGTCLAAALVVVYREPNEDWTVWSGDKSVVFISTIPGGHRQDSSSVRTRIEEHGHPDWKMASQYDVVVRDKKGKGKATIRTIEGPTEIHAEDSAINMWLTYRDTYAQNWEIQDMSMLVYGFKAIKVERLDKRGRPTEHWTVTAEGQIWPCGPHETDPHNEKRPSCQEVLDNMNIYWRFGDIPAKEPTPEPQLPPMPPGYYGGGAGGSGYHPGYASGPVQPTDYGSNVFTSDAVAGLDLAYARKGVAYDAAKRGKTPVKKFCSGKTNSGDGPEMKTGSCLGRPQGQLVLAS